MTKQKVPNGQTKGPCPEHLLTTCCSLKHPFFEGPHKHGFLRGKVTPRPRSVKTWPSRAQGVSQATPWPFWAFLAVFAEGPILETKRTPQTLWRATTMESAPHNMPVLRGSMFHGSETCKGCGQEGGIEKDINCL